MRALNLVAGLTLTVALVGCSDDGGSDAESGETSSPSSSAPVVQPSDTESSSAASPTATPREALEAAYRTYIEAFLTGDGATAYALLSERCRGLNPLSEFAEAAESAAELYGLVEYEIKSVKVNGKRGVLDAEYPVAALNQGGGSEWILEDGEWRSDKCG